MSFLNKWADAIKHAVHPIEQQVNNFSADQFVHSLEQAIEQPVRKKIPGHLSLGEAADVLKIATPSAFDVDIFASFGVEIGVELELQFLMGVTWENPTEVADGIEDLIRNPPATVHQLMDRLWSIKPSEIRISETIQAVIGETGTIRWYGDDLMKHVCEYLDRKGWLEKSLRPS